MKRLMEHAESDTLFIGDDWAYAEGCQDALPTWFPAGTSYPVGNHISTIMPSFDFETYSEVGYTIDERTGKVKGAGAQGKGGLPVVGTPVYAEHHSTRVVCLYYNLKDGKGTRGWVPGTPAPTDLLDHIYYGRNIEAWNITFEWWIWNVICVRQFGWPPLNLPQCFCAMAKSRRHSLPGGLNNAAKVLGSPLKDKEGTRLINKLSRPVSATKNRPLPYWDQSNAWEDYLKFYKYCGMDVDAEDGAAALIPDLTPYERDVWLADQTINVRGVQVDTQALDAAIRIMEEMFSQYTREIQEITGGAVGGASEVAKLTTWLEPHGIFMEDMTADTVDEVLGGWEKAKKWADDGRPFVEGMHPMDPDNYERRLRRDPAAYRTLEIRSILSSANIKKLPTLLMRLSSDGRLRDQYMYCGADRTGRWSAGGVQLQNITAKGPKSALCECCGKHFHPTASRAGCPRCGSELWHKMNDWTVEAVIDAIYDLINGNLASIERIWGDPATLLCGCLRGLFVAKEGTRFVCCDFSAIEAVIAACLSRCQWRIDVFNTHGKIYEMSASLITGTPLDNYLQYKAENGFDHPDRKKIGKVAELASGYGGWIGAYLQFGADGTEEEIKEQVLAWREASPEIVEMWGGQFRQTGPKPWNASPELYGLEGMAILAILNPGQQYWHNDIAYHVKDDILYCRLPSGRFLTYHKPRLVDGDDKLRRGPCYKITFEGHNSNPQKGRVGWQVLDTYGGRLFENVCQAVGADIQAEALVRLEKWNYPVVMHTHDEAISEMDYGRGSVDEMCAIMSERPHWASWWPIRAAGWEHERYQKD